MHGSLVTHGTQHGRERGQVCSSWMQDIGIILRTQVGFNTEGDLQVIRTSNEIQNRLLGGCRRRLFADNITTSRRHAQFASNL